MQVEAYNKQVESISGGGTLSASRDSKKFKWDGTAEDRAKKGIIAEARPLGFRSSVFRPFFRQHFFMDRVLNNSVYQIPRMFPTPDTQNPTIMVERKLRVVGGSPAVLAVNAIPDASVGAGASGIACQALSRYSYPANSGVSQDTLLLSSPARSDNISDDALDAYQSRYGNQVTKDHIFAYVYGILHSPDYRNRYAGELAKMLPRIPEVSTSESFFAFAEAGQELLDLHIYYEQAEPYPLKELVKSDAPQGSDRYLVKNKKMRWGGTSKDPDRSMLRFNDWITLADIPSEAHRYFVGPRSALDWLIDRYYIKTDKRSGIVNDPNDWGREISEPRYIIDLVKRITTVSVETVKIVGALPPLEEAT